MITVGKTSWTDPSETMDAYDFFFAEHGKDVAQPSCQLCGKATCYIVEAVNILREKGKIVYIRPKRPGAGAIANTGRMRMMVKGDSLYFPIQKCEDCSAKYEATVEFKMGNRTCPDLSSRDMTDADKAHYRRIFDLRIQDLERGRGDDMGKSPRKYKI